MEPDGFSINTVPELLCVEKQLNGVILDAYIVIRQLKVMFR